MIEKPVPTSEVEIMQYHTIHDVIAHDHVDVLRREARQARLATKARRRTRPSRRSR